MAVERIIELEELLQSAIQSYYSEGDSSISDEEYDELMDELRSLDSTHPLLQQVGSPITRDLDAKIVHPIPMLSSAKVKTLPDLEKWIAWLDIPEIRLVAQPKVDGLSATIKYENGQLRYIASRGDGVVGQDISHLAPYLQGIALEIPHKEALEIRGELYLPKNTSYDTEGRPLRNNCVGLVNRKEVSEALRHVHFVAYALLNEEALTSQMERLAQLRAWGFAVVEERLCQSLADVSVMVEEYLKTLRETWLYETDGLIFIVDDTALHVSIDGRKVVDRYHHYSMAMKPPAQSRTTQLVAIEWQLSRQGLLIPVGIFDAVEMGGAKISRATLNNVENVERLRLHLGHRILLERANDVIPFVKENLDALSVLAVDATLIPSICPSCGHRLTRSAVHLKCNNLSCPEVAIQSILYWVKKLEMKEIGEQTIAKLYALGKIRHPSDLYRLTYDDLVSLEGFAEKRIENFLREVEVSRTMTALTFLSILGIPLVAKKALIKLSIKSVEDFMAFTDETYVIGRNIIQWKGEEHNRELFEDLKSVLLLTEEAVSDEVSDDKIVVVFTGKGALSRKELQAMAEGANYLVEDNISTKTTLLVTDDVEGNSSKMKRARAKGIEIIRYEDFFARIKD
ncbi:BRCT domain-containing protein [Entomospira culicis]|uniref:DNA ligase (NAD(+)) n=1 Tax=Entomospira culicis TaxID=2719989 RepID=A0A968GEJ7_9SPIO|nr:BRCT domain-containing protein [Entomospira culicis]NIZ18884.1 hypothetical protein [Entomospira culicis]NIZ69099.1 hypothetical protein [Entomospira culicis]WDI37686.1 hypothetical protein PVA46_02575 [Entomospira culicis]WDI39314.1 hypothetical protein PVA47_02580 [Entomospira culicis]